MPDISHANTTLSEGGREIALTLPALMTIETVEQLAAEFKQWPLVEKSSVTLDAGQVENITTPGLQLIVSLEKTLTSQGGVMAIIRKKDSFVRAFKDAGLESVLGKQG